jgi:hypothetical protein
VTLLAWLVLRLIEWLDSARARLGQRLNDWLDGQ